MVTTLIIVAVIGGVIILASLFFSNGGKKKGKKSKKAEPAQEKKVEEKPKDTTFKISKKERVTKISKKSIEADSRTATVERVFERTPEQPESVNTNIEIPLSPEAEAYERELSKVKADDRKVVSFGELQKQAEEMEKNEAERIAEEERLATELSIKPRAHYARDYSSLERYNPEYLLGEYTGFGVGNSSERASIEEIQQKADKEIDEGNQKFEDQLRDSFEKLGLRRTNPFEDSFAQKREEPIADDYSSMVEHEAILNAKYKRNKKK